HRKRDRETLFRVDRPGCPRNEETRLLREGPARKGCSRARGDQGGGRGKTLGDRHRLTWKGQSGGDAPGFRLGKGSEEIEAPGPHRETLDELACRDTGRWARERSSGSSGWYPCPVPFRS